MVIDTVTTPTSRNHVGIGFECRLTLSMHKAHTKKKHVEGSLLPKRKDLVIAPSETKLTSNAAKSNAMEIKFNKQKIMAYKPFALSDLSTTHILKDIGVRSWEQQS